MKMNRMPKKEPTKKLEIIAQEGFKIGEVIMEPNNYSTIVKSNGKRIIPQGEYLLTSPLEIDKMISKRIKNDKLPFGIKRYY